MPFRICLTQLILAASVLETAAVPGTCDGSTCDGRRRAQSLLERDPNGGRPFITELQTEWAVDVEGGNDKPPYPRPALVREGWRPLNGLWDYAVRPNDFPVTSLAAWEGNIRVPFPLESKLSGVQRLLAPGMSLWYRRSFDLPPANGFWSWMLNFEAVDYYCEVFINSKKVGEHTGGNLPFSFDITSQVWQNSSDINTLVVRVTDDTGSYQMRGKQALDPGGIWYTRMSGIWQTVWIEAVEKEHVKKLLFITEDFQKGSVIANVVLAEPSSDPDGVNIDVTVKSKETQIAQETLRNVKDASPAVRLVIPDPQLWSPSSPFLYNVTVTVWGQDRRVIDTVRSYFAIRTVGSSRDDKGHLRFTLNGEQIFHYGLLDQGWWPDGLLTPPSDDAMLHDISYIKAAGWNFVRKHTKVEVRRFYHYCDIFGLMVWQDQVAASSMKGGESEETRWTRMKDPPTEYEWSDQDSKQFNLELEQMIDLLEFHPCIVVWTPFNECWGQHRTNATAEWLLNRDKGRLINVASGGNFYPIGHIADAHVYPEPNFPFDSKRFDEKFIKVIGEFGGHGMYIAEHSFSPDTGPSWGYDGLAQNLTEFAQKYATSLCNLAKQRNLGLAAGVYTQLTDVEIEVNGLMTYDRKYYKIPVADLKEMHRAFFEGEASACQPWPRHSTTTLQPEVVKPTGVVSAGMR